MRTSMITTSGLRRSASATALAPSGASPITRMCGARDSDRRRPSRTTSWSSTIRQVISAGVANAASGSVIGGSDCQRELFRLELTLQAHGPPVADTILPFQLDHPLPDRADLVGAEIGPPGVEALVLGQQL